MTTNKKRMNSNIKPSMETKEYWLYAVNQHINHPKITPPLEFWDSMTETIYKYGKWLIFRHINEIDEIWMRVKKATEDGKLGHHSKVTTAKSNPEQVFKNQMFLSDEDTKIIFVYTLDWNNSTDVMRVREELRTLGVTEKIPYKADIDTLMGCVLGNKWTPKYYK